MTPADEAEFIALWEQGLSQDTIAQQLGIPVGTVKSRAYTLAHAGKLTPRPRGGAYPIGANLSI
jgi:DNA-directed RNA polymerase specialized sigma24 family protein